MPESAHFFEGLKVIELASVLAGPAVGMFFAELGAQVIKIENKSRGGDVTRTWRLPQEDKSNPFSAYYCSVNYGKESLMLDLSNPKDKELLEALLGEADIVISNYRPKVAEKWSLDYSSIKKTNPSVLFGHISGYPDSDRAAFDVVLQAETGFLSMSGESGRPPAKMPVALIDILAAHQLKEALLLAYIHKLKSGEGSAVYVNLFESALASLANQATNWLVAGHIPQPMGCQHPNIAPYGDLFYSQEGNAFVLAVGSDQQFEELCILLGNEQWAKEDRFAKNQDRLANRAALVELLQTEFAKHKEAYWAQLFDEKSVPAGFVRNMKEVFSQKQTERMVLDWKAPNQKAFSVRSVAFQWEN